MEKIFLSDAGPKVSPAVYGFYRWTSQDLAAGRMESVVEQCLELGINTFDHADIYGDYGCEEAFGTLIKQKSIRREEVVLFTKCGVMVPSSTRPEVRTTYYDTSKEHILRSLEASLRKLQTDYIDVFLLHQLDPLSNLEETAYTLQQLKQSGKIRQIGVVNFTVFQHQLLSSYLRTPVVSNHIEFNLLNTAALENGQIDYMKQCYVRPLATAPLAEGRIATGEDDHAQKVRAVLQEIGQKYGADPESIAVAWLVKLGALPLIGTTDHQRIRNIADAFALDLDRQDWYAIYAATKGIL